MGLCRRCGISKEFIIYSNFSFIKVLINSLIPLVLLFLLQDYLADFIIEGTGVVFFLSCLVSSLYFYAKRKQIGYMYVSYDSIEVSVNDKSYNFTKNNLLDIKIYRQGFSVLKPASKITINQHVEMSKALVLNASQVELDKIDKTLKLSGYNIQTKYISGFQLIFHLLKD